MNAPLRYGRATPEHDSRVAAALRLLERAATEHRGRVVLTTSLGAEDMVLTDLIARHALPIPLATLDTGALHEQTIELRERVQQHYGLAIEVFHPRQEQLVHFVGQHGSRAMYRSVELRRACCTLRKLEPLERLLHGREAWVTGLRGEQSPVRSALQPVTRDEGGRLKFSPLLDWQQADVWHYLGRHGVPYNALHDQFHPSIGCAPCTRAVALGEDERSGRWWWENAVSKECGLHTARPAAAERAEVAA